MIKFNLIEEPWIPVIKAGKIPTSINLKECLLKAHEISDIYHNSPLVIVGVYRLLLAIIHRLYAPKSSTEWNSIWSTKQFDESAVETYLQKWHNRFNLIDSQYPFYQVAEHPAGDEIISINKIVIHRSAGNNAVFQDHSNDHRYDPLSLSEATLNLIAYQVFSPGGGKSKTINLQHSPLTSPISTLLIGNNLFETFLLNTLINPQIKSSKDDKPYWEQNGKINFESKSKVSGYLDYLTLQSRIVKLFFKETESGVVAEGVQIAQGRGLDKDILEPFAKYKLNKEEGLVPIKVNIHKQLWREYYSLTGLTSESTERSPLNLKQAAELEELGILPGGVSLRIFCGGLATDKAKILLWRFDKLPLPLNLLLDRDCMNLIESAILFATDKSSLLWKRTNTAAKQLISDNVSSADKETAKQLQKTLSSETLYWSMLETPFKEFVILASGNSGMEEKAFEFWKQNCTKAYNECWKQIEDSIINSPRGPEAIAQAFYNIKTEVNNG
jgi:CRISPR system Cascade subunit CasA